MIEIHRDLLKIQTSSVEEAIGDMLRNTDIIANATDLLELFELRAHLKRLL